MILNYITILRNPITKGGFDSGGATCLTLLMYVYMHIYMCNNVYVCVHIYIYIYIYISPRHPARPLSRALSMSAPPCAPFGKGQMPRLSLGYPGYRFGRFFTLVEFFAKQLESGPYSPKLLAWIMFKAKRIHHQRRKWGHCKYHFVWWTFGVLPLTFYIPNSAGAYLFPQSVKIHSFCSGPN